VEGEDSGCEWGAFNDGLSFFGEYYAIFGDLQGWARRKPGS